MNNTRRLNAVLWTGNVLLIIGIVAFAFQFLIFQDARTRGVEAPVTVPPGGSTLDPTDTQALAKLPNPLLPPKPTEREKGPSGPVKLIGTVSFVDAPEDSMAYVVLPARNLNVNAYVGEPVRDESAGQEVSEMSGWRLKSVTPKTAVFSTPEGEKTLHLEEITASAPVATGIPGIGAPLTGAAWEPAKYATKKNPGRSNENQESWDIDKKEVDWAAANVDTILAGVSLEPYSGGGLKINTLPEGTFAAERGLRTGDVVKSVNGQPIESIAKLNDVMRGLSKNATTLTVIVDRSGRGYTLQYVVPRGGR